MDGDPAVEPELDSFSLTFPLPYRVAFIAVLAVWGWALNLHYLYLLKIDVPALIRYPQRSSLSQRPHHVSTYRLAIFLSATFATSISLFWLLTHRNPALVIDYDWLPMTYLLVLALLFVIPLRNLSVSHAGRGRALATLRRISIGGLAETKDGRFGDILMADVLTSYAKILGDLYVCLCMFFMRSGSATQRPDRSCGGMVMVPLIMSVPSLIRFRQCLIDYGRTRRSAKGGTDSSDGFWGSPGTAHLANAAKYASAFPVTILSVLQRNLDTSTTAAAALNRAWLVAALFHSLYSFFWDVDRDWDLTLLGNAKERNAPEHRFGLRRRLLIGPPALYYAAILLDLVLRCTWSLKLSPHLDHLTDFESSIFVIELLEVLRRWVWIFFRVETEWIRKTSTGLGPDDILLNDFDGKLGDED